jgi:hypothetical protein
MHALLFTFIFQGLAILAFCCLVKAILDFTPLKRTALQKPLLRITSPILKVTHLITPTLIPQTLHIFLAAIWLLAARVAFYMGAAAFGLLPAIAS